MCRVLLLATTTGYQTREFGEAAERLGVDLVFATDRCHVIDDPWQDGAIPIRFYDEDHSVRTLLDSLRFRPIDGVLAVGDRPTVIAARVAERLGLPGHPPAAAEVARDKERSRARLRDAGLLVPWFVPSPLSGDPGALVTRVDFPCVIKPVALSGSRGVMRADNVEQFLAVHARLQALMRQPEIRAEQNAAHERLLIEGFIPGREFALEGVLHHCALTVLALFDKPDPLDGPFFEETIYVTPSSLDADTEARVIETVARAAAAIGLTHGPIHAECRVNDQGVFVLEVAARPIGGLCARALRFEKGGRTPFSLEELLLRHAIGESPEQWGRESRASGVMMIPIPHRGVFRRADGLDEARAVPGIDDIRITAKADQLLIPLPEGASYLGFIFARADQPRDVDRALRAAHQRLRFAIDPEIPLVIYNHSHG
jgi:ATP-grasp domain/L-amino acid ligase C-terminal domain 2/ATP-grasp N-terminal domain